MNIKWQILQVYYELTFLEVNERKERVATITKSKSNLFKALIEKTPGKITKREIAQACPDISVTTIERTLAELTASGFIDKVGVGRSTAYVKK